MHIRAPIKGCVLLCVPLHHFWGQARKCSFCMQPFLKARRPSSGLSGEMRTTPNPRKEQVPKKTVAHHTVLAFILTFTCKVSLQGPKSYHISNIMTRSVVAGQQQQRQHLRSVSTHKSTHPRNGTRQGHGLPSLTNR